MSEFDTVCTLLLSTRVLLLLLLLYLRRHAWVPSFCVHEEASRMVIIRVYFVRVDRRSVHITIGVFTFPEVRN